MNILTQQLTNRMEWTGNYISELKEKKISSRPFKPSLKTGPLTGHLINVWRKTTCLLSALTNHVHTYKP